MGEGKELGARGSFNRGEEAVRSAVSGAFPPLGVRKRRNAECITGSLLVFEGIFMDLRLVGASLNQEELCSGFFERIGGLGFFSEKVFDSVFKRVVNFLAVWVKNPPLSQYVGVGV